MSLCDYTSLPHSPLSPPHGIRPCCPAKELLGPHLSRQLTLGPVFFFFFNLKKFYLLFILFFACTGSSLLRGLFSSCGEQELLSCGARASHCSGFSCCRAWALGCVGFRRLPPRLQSTGSVIVAHRLSYSAARGILLGQGSNPCLLRWQADSLPLSHQECPSAQSLYLPLAAHALFCSDPYDCALELLFCCFSY